MVNCYNSGRWNHFNCTLQIEARYWYFKFLELKATFDLLPSFFFYSVEVSSCCKHRLTPKGFVTSLLLCGMRPVPSPDKEKAKHEKSKRNSAVTSIACLCRLNIRQQRAEKQLVLLSHMESCSLCGGGVLIYWL